MATFPAIFIGHGSPMNALERNEFSLEWEKLGKQLPKPKGIVCISAHWTTNGSFVTAMDEPRTIHDFYGFPEELSQVQYPAPGNPVLANDICQLMHNKIKPDLHWGFDHGCWSVLNKMYPDAEVPTIQISLDIDLTPKQHFEQAQRLQFLREQGILVLGSGNIVHNLSKIFWSDEALPWAVEFDELVKEKIIQRDFNSLFQIQDFGLPAKLSVPSIEHYLPFLFILGMTTSKSEINFLCEKVTMGAISMRSIVVNN